jgi:hypothetical protein
LRIEDGRFAGRASRAFFADKFRGTLVLRRVTFWKTPAAGDELRFHRICLVAAFAVTFLWGAIYIGHGNTGIEDEPGHMGAIEHLARKLPGVPASLPNLPGYHFLVIFLSGGEPTLRSARVVTLGLALAGLAAFAAAWRQRHGKHPGGMTLLLALLPIMQPFTAMAYTDVPAMTFLFLAFWAQFAGRFALAAGALALACLVRQTSLVWAGYLLAIQAMDCFFPKTPAAENVPTSFSWSKAFHRWLDSSRWLLLLVATGLGTIVYAGRLTLGTEHGIRPEPNLATVHFGGALLLLIGLPFWVANLRGMLRSVHAASQKSPGRILGFAALGLGIAAALAMTYTNRYVWNRELFWTDPGSTYVLLRNWPLVWMERIEGLRWVSGLIVVAVAVGLAFLCKRERDARELWLILPFGALLLLSNELVEPRYFMPPCALALLFLEPGRNGLLRQIRWFALLCLLTSPFTLQRLALW